MPTGPCPNCKSPITITKGQASIVCENCGTGYKVTVQEGNIRLRRAEVQAAAAKQGKLRPRKRVSKAAPRQQSNRAFIIGVAILVIILIVGIVATALIIAARPASADQPDAWQPATLDVRSSVFSMSFPPDPRVQVKPLADLA